MENPARPENKKTDSQIITDTSEIVRRHLEDKNHEITDEEIRNIKVVGEGESIETDDNREPGLLKAREDVGDTSDNN